ncbi:unnamed protein product, partial [Nesidiocoris tenuis]
MRRGIPGYAARRKKPDDISRISTRAGRFAECECQLRLLPAQNEARASNVPDMPPLAPAVAGSSAILRRRRRGRTIFSICRCRYCAFRENFN